MDVGSRSFSRELERRQPFFHTEGAAGSNPAARTIPAPLRDCLKNNWSPATRDFVRGRGGETGASPQRAVTVEPTKASRKRPVARRVFAEKALWLRCSSVTDRWRVCSLVAPRHRAFSAKTGPPTLFFRQSLRARLGLCVHLPPPANPGVLRRPTSDNRRPRNQTPGWSSHSAPAGWPPRWRRCVQVERNPLQQRRDDFATPAGVASRRRLRSGRFMPTWKEMKCAIVSVHFSTTTMSRAGVFARRRIEPWRRPSPPNHERRHLQCRRPGRSLVPTV